MTNWVRRDGWEIDDGPKHVYLKGVPHTYFKLIEESVGGLTRYRVVYDMGEMDEAWQDCWLIERGQEPFPWEDDPLPEWNGQKYDYDRAIGTCLLDATANTVRLEGEIRVRDRNGVLVKEAVTMFLAERAAIVKGVVDDLLIILTRKHFLWSKDAMLHPKQDGTAHAKQR